jgi:hypothetical protein
MSDPRSLATVVQLPLSVEAWSALAVPESEEPVLLESSVELALMVDLQARIQLTHHQCPDR